MASYPVPPYPAQQYPGQQYPRPSPPEEGPTSAHVRPGCWTTPIRGALAVRALLTAVAYGAGALVLAVLALLGVRVATGHLPGPAVSALVLMAPTYLVVPPALWVHVLRPRGLGWADLGWRRPAHNPLHLLWQIPAVLAVGAFVSALVLLPTGGGAASDGGQDAVADLTLGGRPLAVLGLLLVAVLVPVVEELLFRGVLLPALRAPLTVVPGVLLCGLVFALVHLLPPALPYLLVAGVALAAMAEWYRSVLPGMVLHGVNNALVFVLLLGP